MRFHGSKLKREKIFEQWFFELDLVQYRANDVYCLLFLDTQIWYYVQKRVQVNVGLTS